VTDWNFADVWETVAATLPTAPATSHARLRRSWVEFEARSEAQAAWLASLGLDRQARVAQYLYSGPEYLESLFACFKASYVPVNTNYRYGPDELSYLWADAGCSAVVFHGSFTGTIDQLREKEQVTTVRGWLWVDDGTYPCPRWASDFETIASSGSRIASRPARSGDDLWLLYTGGTTGNPKGVMWRQDDIFCTVNRTAALRYPEDADLAGVAALLEHPGPVVLPAAPLMHGTGTIAAFGALSSAGCVVTLTGRSFDPVEMLDLIEAERVKAAAIVGDAFAKPLLRELDRHPRRWDISSLRVISSSGVMWSSEVRRGLLAHNPNLILVDTLGSSEAIGMATSIMSAGAEETASTATFRLGPDTQVFTDDGRIVRPGTGEVGVLGLRGRGPLGYFNDEAKSAKTFRMVDGVRWSVPGDHATVERDGTITLLGRGSQCINTGGEKVYPEEVEEVLKAQPTVADAAVVGVDDDRFGQAVTALVALVPGAPFDESTLIASVKSSLAAYKAPKRVLAVDDVGRAPNGKLDYNALRALAAAMTAD
jgi:acyl-CoA synthetase (AMP-forming)/AMP-acid ligase II